MTTLFERILSTSEDGADKISIHMIQALISEKKAGRLTGAQAVSIINLTAGQITDINRIIAAAASSSDKGLFISRVFSYLVLGENRYRAGVNGGLDGYAVESNFWLMIDAEAIK